MRIVLAQINTTVGDFAGNEAKIVAAYRRASTDGAELMVVPEVGHHGLSAAGFVVAPRVHRGQ
jgi:NAD+ synthase (glutamine-hydrolysing)